jgi:cysteinyl-tRNA synthetase
LEQSRASLDGLYGALREVQDIELDMDVVLEGEAFYNALNDDLNTPIAIAELHALAKALNKADESDKPNLKARILAGADLLGILQSDPEEWFQGTASAEAISAEDIEALVAQRQQAKLDKDYALADKLREDLKAQGVVLEDSRDGTSWRRL